MFTSRCVLFAGLFLTPLALSFAQETKSDANSNRNQTTRADAQDAGQASGQSTTQRAGQNTAQGQRAGQSDAKSQAQQSNAGQRTGGLQQGQAGGQATGQAHITAHSGAHANQLNKFMLSCLRNGNQKEIAISKLAEQKSSHEEVKAFAQQMVKDHTEFLAKLDRIHQEGAASGASGATSTRSETRTEVRTGRSETKEGDRSSDTSNRREEDQDSDTATDRTRTNVPGARSDVRVDTARGDVTVAAAGAGMSGNLDQIMRIEKEVSDRCLATAQRELGEKQGKEFDKCFMFMQVGAHLEMADKLTVFKNHASGELQQVIDEGLQTTQQHLQHAKQLAQKIDDGSASDASGAARRDANPGSNVNRRGAAGSDDANNSTNRRPTNKRDGEEDANPGRRANEGRNN